MQVVAGKSFVSQNFSFPTYAKALVKMGQSQTDVDNYVLELENSIREKVYNKMYLTYYAVYASNPDSNYQIGSKQVDFKTANYNAKTDKIEFSFNFNSYSAWNYYHPSSSNEGDDDEESSNLFLSINISNANFPFSEKVIGESVGERYANIIDTALLNNFSQSIIDELDELNFSYDYVSSHKRLHSNADEQVSNSGYYHHIWSLSRSNLDDGKVIEIKTVNAVRGWWYLIVLATVIGSVGLGSLIIFVSNKIKVNKENKKEA